MRRYLCGVPGKECRGSLAAVSGGGDYNKVHASPEEAFKCYADYLVKQGYTKVGAREYAAPNGGPIKVLTKKSRFGCALRPGKRGDKTGVDAKRVSTIRVGGGIISQ